jgi:hypothetical protein
LVTSVTGWTTNVTGSTAATLGSFRVSASDSVWNAIIRIVETTGKDIKIDQLNKVVYLYDKLNRPDIFSFVEGKNAIDINRKKSRSKAGKVIVFGKGDGENQIKGSYGTGVPVHVVIDKNIIKTAEATARATIEYNKLNPNPKSYTFNPIVPIDDLIIGDSGVISNTSAGINEAVDLVRYEISVNEKGIENLKIEVTNPDYRRASKNLAESQAKSDANYYASQSSMQGATNIWGDTQAANASTTVPLKLTLYVPDNVEDESATNRINKVLLSYKHSAYREDYGALGGYLDAGGNSDGGYYYPDPSSSITCMYTDTGLTVDGVFHDVANSTPTLSSNDNHSFHAISGTLYLNLSCESAGNQNVSVYLRAKISGGATSYYPNSYGILHFASYNFRLHTHAITSITDDAGEHRHEPDDGGYFWTSSSSSCSVRNGCAGFTDEEPDHYHAINVYSENATRSVMLIAVPFFIYMPSLIQNKTITLQYSIENNPAITYYNKEARYYYLGFNAHTHGITNMDVTGGALTEAATNATRTDIIIKDGAGSTVWTSADRAAIAETDIDITSYVSDPDTYTIEIYPDKSGGGANAYTYGNVYIKSQIDS